MKGETLKEQLKTTRYSLAEIANMMGISPQSLNSIFNSSDVKSGVLEKLSSVLRVPLSFFYGDTFNITGSGNATGNHSTNTVNATDEKLLALLQSKDDQLTMAMKQTCKAQEQMDRVLNKCGF
jgi:transcriptional regulator with XRE-family HTH domain